MFVRLVFQTKFFFADVNMVSQYCKQEQVPRENTQHEVHCVNCQEVGHRARDCPKERVNPFACKNCNQGGHISKECTEPRSATNVECRKCSQIGHFSKDVSVLVLSKMTCADSSSAPTSRSVRATTVALRITWQRNAISLATLLSSLAVTARSRATCLASVLSLRIGPKSSATTVGKWVTPSR